MLCNSCYNSCCTCCTPSNCTPVPTTTTTTTTTTLCPDPLPCDEAYSTDCIVYSGCNDSCSKIKTGDSLTEVFATLFEMTNQCILPTTTTTTTTIAPQAFKCEDCLFTLENVTQNNISILSVGNLNPGACSGLENYVIDWYLDDTSSPIQFTSGNSTNTDPDIVQFHPFIGSNARPCVAGNWIPVIRYVYIAGIKYTSSYEPGPGRIYSPDLASCLEPIVVQNLNCSNGNPSIDYSHSLSYQAVIQNPSDSTRTFNFDLDSVTNFFAWQFYGYTVSDKIEFYYVSGVTQTSLGKYAIGIDITTGTNFTGAIKQIREEGFKEVFDLSGFTFTTGDYIRIDITSSYFNPTNQNTNWIFECKCLETFDCTVLTPAVIDPCSSVMTFDSVSCTYRLTYNYSSYPDNTSTDTYKYLTYQLSDQNGSILHYPNPSEPYITYDIQNGEFCGYGVFNPGACTNSSLKTITKVGSVITIDFTNQAEYLLWKNEYTTIYNNLNITYSSDTSNVNHFKFFRFAYYYDPGLTGCGDTINTKQIYFHFTSPVTFDDVNYIMVVDITNTVNTMPPRCNNSCSNLTAMTEVASIISSPDYGPISSTVRPSNQGYFIYSVQTSTLTTGDLKRFSQHFLPYGFSNYICNQEPNLCEVTYGSYSELKSYFLSDKVTITDITDGVNNYKIETLVDSNGCESISPTIVYEIANGIVITPNGGCP